MKPKPQRFWAVRRANGHLDYRSIWTYRLNTEDHLEGSGDRVVRVEVRVVEPKRKRKARKP